MPHIAVFPSKEMKNTNLLLFTDHQKMNGAKLGPDKKTYHKCKIRLLLCVKQRFAALRLTKISTLAILPIVHHKVTLEGHHIIFMRPEEAPGSSLSE